MSNIATSSENDRVAIQLASLIQLAKPATQLKLGHHHIKALHSGSYLSPFKGRGMEFDETRVYQAGDDIRSIDWRVTARSNQTHTKIFREEKERPVFVSVDHRQTMEFATRGSFKYVQAAKLAALLAWAAHNQGDRIGGQLFSDHSCKELKPQNGRRAVLAFLNLLSQQTHHSPEKITLPKVLARLVHHARPGSLIYLISDFRGLEPSVERDLAKLIRHCELILVHIYDPLESHLPSDGIYNFTDGKQDVVINTDDKKVVTEYQHQFKKRVNHLESLCKKWQIRLLHCSTTDDPIEVLR